jgi:hypothetical protein
MQQSQMNIKTVTANEQRLRAMDKGTHPPEQFSEHEDSPNI